MSGTATVEYSAAAGTPSSGSEFSLTPGTLTFGPADRFRTFTLTITSDAAGEGPETIRLALRVPPDGAASLGTNATAVVTIPGTPPASASR